MADPRHPRAAEPGSISAQSHDTAAGLPGSGALDRLPEKALILAAAHESSTHAEWAEGSNGEATLERSTPTSAASPLTTCTFRRCRCSLRCCVRN
jgi:hypothetical protein